MNHNKKGTAQKIVHRIWFCLCFLCQSSPLICWFSYNVICIHIYIYMFIKFQACLLVFKIYYIHILYYIYTRTMYVYTWSSSSTLVCCFSYVFIQLLHVVPVWIRGTLAPVHRQAIWPAASEAPPVVGWRWLGAKLCLLCSFFFWRTLGLCYEI